MKIEPIINFITTSSGATDANKGIRLNASGYVDSTFFGPGLVTANHGDLTGLIGTDHHTQYLLASGTKTLAGDWDAGSYKITAEQFESDIAAGTAPLIVASNTLVTNLNADLLDGLEETAFYLANGSRAITGTIEYSGASKIDLSVNSEVTITNNAETEFAAFVCSGVELNNTTKLQAPSDGNLLVTNQKGDDFSLLQLGGTTSSFPALKRNGVELESKLSDDSDYAYFVCSGIKYEGEVWDDLVVPIAASRAPTSNPPVLATFLNNVEQYYFDTGDQIFGAFQMPHSWDRTTSADVHLHWAPSTTNTGTVQWKFEYTAIDINGTFGATNTVDLADAAHGTAYKHQIAENGTLSGISNISAVICYRLYRDSTDDTFTGNPFALSLDIHYRKDSNGSDQEWLKTFNTP